MTQVELAEAIGITQPTLSLLESGRTRLSILIAKRLASTFGISVDTLIADEDEVAA